MNLRKTIRGCLLAPLLAACAGLHAATPLEQMHAALTEWVGAQNGVPASQVLPAPLDSRIQVQPCAGALSFDYPFVSHENVRVRCQKPSWQLFVKVGFATAAKPEAAPQTAKPAPPLPDFRQVVVAAVNMSAGQTLQRESLKLEHMDAEKVSKAYYLEMDGLEGQELMRALRAGEPIRVSDLRQATLVKRGDMVLMTVGTSKTFEISVKAEAMQDGKMGEQIKLRNTESGRTLAGIVTGKGTVKGL